MYDNIMRFPINTQTSNIINVIEKYGYLYYKKEIKLTKNGIINLIEELYRGEKWIGGMFPNDSCGGKFDYAILIIQ